MKVLVVGSGGREHAICWKLAQSASVREVLCAPGNAGIAAVARCVAVNADDVAALVRLAQDEAVQLVVIGPEAPLVAGLADRLTAAGIPAFGPSSAAARLEGSKAFAKELMHEAGVPTARYRISDNLNEALAIVHEFGAPLVVKASGLAAGKGVIIAETVADAEAAVRDMLAGNRFGDAGSQVVIEEFLVGEEASCLFLVSGEVILPLASSQDHKRLLDDDHGPNTGGMGAYSPAPCVTDEVALAVLEQVAKPTIAALKQRGVSFVGILYAGIMLTKTGPMTLEFNTRFGDPECQALLPRLKNDLGALLLAAATGQLAGQNLEWDERPAVTVVVASRGYPNEVTCPNQPIFGLDEVERAGALVFHAGTALKDGQIVNRGGRVLTVTALGADIIAARNAAYRALGHLVWPGGFYRRDIGWRAVARVAPQVLILMGSANDMPTMEKCAAVLGEYGVRCALKVRSAHRTPEATIATVRQAEKDGCQVFICAAGMAAHLAGAVAAHTVRPVIGVPIASGPLQGQDALLSTVMMPPGIPVATVGIGGARNAGLLAIQILALTDGTLREKLLDARRNEATPKD